MQASGTDNEGACPLVRQTLATVMLEGGADIRASAVVVEVSVVPPEHFAQVSG